MFKCTLCIIILITIAGSIYAQDELKPLQKAPAFSLRLFDSRVEAFSKSSGKEFIKSKDIFVEKELTVLIFWDSYCPDCLRAVVECQKFYESSRYLNVGVWSVNFDKENIIKARLFMQAEGISFPVLSDPVRNAVNKYKAGAYDFSFFIIDKSGIIRYVSYDHPPDVADVIKAEVTKLLKKRLNVSEPAPGFSLKTLDGSKTVESKEIFQQKELTVLIFWNSQDKACLNAVMECEKLYKNSEKGNFTVLSINFDKVPAKARDFVREKGLTLPVLFDTDSAITESYKSEDYCFSAFIVDNKGMVKHASYGPLAKIHEVIENEIVKVK